MKDAFPPLIVLRRCRVPFSPCLRLVGSACRAMAWNSMGERDPGTP